MNLFPVALGPELNDSDKSRSRKAWQRLLSEPLLHFLVIGICLFGAYRMLNNAVSEPTIDAQSIVLTKDDVRQMAISWLAQGRSLAADRGPT